ncbi:YqgQ family protein [Bacillaceae bacterium W0354]
MNNFYDLQQLLKRFGTYIYLGNRLADLELMEEEIRTLYENQLITNEQFTKGLLIIKHERNKIN